VQRLSSLAGSARDRHKPPRPLGEVGGDGNSPNVRQVPGTCKKSGCQYYIQNILLTFMETLGTSDNAGEEWRGGGGC